MSDCLIIIPARGGSKRLPGKNILPLAGKPLIAWTIEAAKKSKLLAGYAVSTEDKKIAAVAAKYGAQVICRPEELASDEATTLTVMQHALSQIDADILVLLQPTSPIRKRDLIDESIKEFIEGGYDSLATGFICKYKEYGTCHSRRQELEGFFYDDGNIYVIKADLIRKCDRYGKKICRKLISRWENVEIDDNFDFWIAEQILMHNKQCVELYK